MGPARHTAGHNVASYHHGADDAIIELYNDVDVFVPELGYASRVLGTAICRNIPNTGPSHR